MNIKNNLKEIRLKEYMMDSKTEFAKLLGVGLHTYSNWENGTLPNLKTALDVARKLNKKVEEIWHLE